MKYKFIRFIRSTFRSSHSITLRVILYLLVFSIIFSLFSVSYQLYSSYEKEIEDIKKQLIQIEGGYGNAFALGIWNVDETIIERLSKGIVSLSDIQSVEIISHDLDRDLFFGRRAEEKTVVYRFPLRFIDYQGKRVNLGTVILTATTENVIKRLNERIFVISITEIIKALVISLFMFIMIYQLFTRHLNDIVDYFNISPLVWLKKKLVLKHYRYKKFSSSDELQKVVKAINHLRSKQLEYISEIENAEKESRTLSEKVLKANEELNLYKKDLEKKVVQRTNELQISLENLKKSQEDLVESEKMASLGQLVIGIAHEINTPMGVAITAASYLSDQTQEFIDKSSSSKLTKKQLESYIRNATDSSNIILNNLFRTSKLIGSFKQISVKDNIGEKSIINIKSFIDEILIIFQSRLEAMHISVDVICKSDITVNSYSFAVSQIIMTLLNNSIEHAFEGIDDRSISIEVMKLNREVKILYKDSGSGISEENIKQIFDPFFTTNRGGGSIGLGLTIVYNTITQVLMGYIKCISKNGTTFEIGFKE